MHWSGATILLLFIVAAGAVMLFLLHLTRAGRILHERIPDRPRRRLFLASLSFFVTFLGVRAIVLLILYHRGPFGWVELGGLHVHHLVWGIFLLLVSGFALVAEFGEEATPMSLFVGRLIAILYGMGAALTLDEFEFWLNIGDSPWTFHSRVSLDAVTIFGMLLAVGAWGAPLWTRRPRKARPRPRKKLTAR